MSSPEIMRKIVEAESEGKKILRQTESEIAKMKRDLSAAIASMKEQILRDAAERKDLALMEAQRAGDDAAERIAHETKKQVEALSRIPEARRKEALEKALALIIS